MTTYTDLELTLLARVKELADQVSLLAEELETVTTQRDDLLELLETTVQFATQAIEALQ